jgi:hypothetical protein
MGNVTLYEIGERYRTAFEALGALQEEGEINELMVSDTLGAIEAEFNDKAINVGAYLLGLDAFIDQVDDEVGRLQKIAKRAQTQRQALHSYLKAQMEKLGIKKIESKAAPFLRLTIKPNPPRLVMDDPKAIPDEYVRQEMTLIYEKEEIKRALKAGIEVPGVHLESGSRLEVK